MAAPKYEKQPSTLKNGAWVRFRAGRYARIAGVVGQIVTTRRGSDSYDVEVKDGSTVQGARACDIALLAADEAAPYIAARAARLAREHQHRMRVVVRCGA